MIRTQIFLDEDQAQDITILAKSQKTKKAKLIRSLIQKGLEQEKNKQSVGNTLLELANLGKKLKLKGPKDLSSNHDQYLYNE